MSGPGAPKGIARDAAGAAITVVASLWHPRVMNGLISGARDVLLAAGAKPLLVRVPGAFELPLGVSRAVWRLRREGAGGPGESVIGVVALGVVIRGGTPHFEYVCRAATDGLAKVALDLDVPVGFGLLTCDDEAQALDRAGLPSSSEDKGGEAAEAVLAMLATDFGGSLL